MLIALVVGALLLARQDPEAIVVAGPLDAGAQPTPVLAVDVAPTPVTAVAEPLDAGARPSPLPDPPDDETPSLKLFGRRAGGAFMVTNRNRTAWTQCRITIPKQRTARIGTIPAASSAETPLDRFHFDPQAPELKRALRVDCAEGFGQVELR